ncbi:probable disease resistance protein At4g27220 [Cucurbita maxima]|uniref:Probable disease resistance protein At4g27220 n=1 Tax=Cucurbita maxima TaxID=3661 RepID=A0A6J1KDH0_CUCMA|nr:probable disease resistance protein At4g27220 [Cucurbita maxima]
MDIVISVVAKVGECMVKPIGRQMGYLIFYQSYVTDLEYQLSVLENTRRRVQHKVDEARRNAEDILVDVQEWLIKVDKVDKEIKIFLLDGNQSGNKCCSGSCFFSFQRYQLSKKAKIEADNVKKMKEEGNFDKVSIPGALPGVGSSAIKGFLTFGSRISVMNEIIAALIDSKVSMVGVYGMGGVGKTMLVKEISRHVREVRLFDEVVMVTIGQIPDIRSIQSKIGDMLSLSFKQESVEGRAALLQKRLKKENKILVVLDDMWEELDLETVGIPYGEDRERCKILITSRHHHVLYNKMSIRNTFEVKFLNEEESWNFFKSKAGESLEISVLKSVASEVAKECVGLPIALSTVAKALSGKPLPIWRDALKQLQNPAAVNEGVGKEAHASVELSYKYVESEEAKLLFLLCSVFHEDYDINMEKLLIYAFGLRLLQHINSLADARDRMVKLVDVLKSSCLLLDSDRGDNFVKMHDVVRNVAISIAYRDDRMCTMSYGRGSTEWRKDGAFRKCNAVLINTENFHNLPQKMMFPKLELLVLVQGTSFDPCIHMPEDFLMELAKLKVLELHNMQISLSSFHSLAYLRILRLWFCELGNMDMIKELKELEILSLRGCYIKELPPALGQLTQLKSLDLKYCYKLEMIPPNVLSKLTKLEELDMEESFVGWDGVGLTSKTKNASLLELHFLTCLTTLCLCVPDASIMPKQLFLDKLKLERFQIVIGREWPDYTFNTFKVMCLKVDSEILLSEGIKRLLCESEELHLEVPVTIGNHILFELDKKDVPPLKHLVFHHFDEQYLVSEASLKGFTNLELLALNRMKSLQSIINERLRVVPFNKLKIIKVEDCKILRNLFYSSIMSGLSNLQQIHVSNCEMIETIVAMENEATSQFECSKLSSLSLTGLPQLTSFCLKVDRLRQKIQDDVQQHSEIAQEYELSDCIPFFNEQVTFPSLKTLVLKGLHKLKTIWPNRPTMESFSKLKRIELTSCQSLRIVFPSNTIRSLKSLEKLEIRSCELIEEIFQWSDANEEGEIFSSQLRHLDLHELPRLKNVWNRVPQELVTFQSIASVTVEGCPELKSLFPASFTTNLQLLESLVLERCGLEEIFVKEERFETTKTQFVFSKVSFLTLDCTLVMRDLWHGQSLRVLFPKLKALALLGSDVYKWSISMTNLPFGFVELLFIVDELHVIDSFLVELFPSEGFFTAEERRVGISVPLRRLSLLRLPKIVNLWKTKLEVTPSFHNLEVLEVEDCSRLNSLFQSLSSLHNLRCIRIVACHGLVHLMDSSVAKVLVQLQELHLSACKKMSTIIAKGEEEDEIVFSQLKILELFDLPNLSTFHSGKSTIKFPCLKKVVMKKCPEMKAFSCGVVTTPEHCWYAKWGSDEGFWTSNVNATINQLWDNDLDTSLQSFFVEEVELDFEEQIQEE